MVADTAASRIVKAFLETPSALALFV